MLATDYISKTEHRLILAIAFAALIEYVTEPAIEKIKAAKAMAKISLCSVFDM